MCSSYNRVVQTTSHGKQNEGQESTRGSHSHAPQRGSAGCAGDRGWSISQVGGSGRISGSSRPPVHAGCEMRTSSPVTGSANDVCVVTLLRVVVDVTVALCAIGGAAGAGSPSPGGGGEVK